MKRIWVYCGSSDRIPQTYLGATFQLRQTIADRGMILVYGTSSTGMMGAVANGALQAGGEMWGVIPNMFDTPESLIVTLLNHRFPDGIERWVERDS